MMRKILLVIPMKTLTVCLFVSNFWGVTHFNCPLNFHNHYWMKYLSTHLMIYYFFYIKNVCLCVCAIKGGVDEGEDPRDAAIRELREETGVTSAEIIAEVWFLYSMLLSSCALRLKVTNLSKITLICCRHVNIIFFLLKFLQFLLKTFGWMFCDLQKGFGDANITDYWYFWYRISKYDWTCRNISCTKAYNSFWLLTILT